MDRDTRYAVAITSVMLLVMAATLALYFFR
jgi:hypothetical protein